MAPFSALRGLCPAFFYLEWSDESHESHPITFCASVLTLVILFLPTVKKQGMSPPATTTHTKL